jgi:hypothetical protein
LVHTNKKIRLRGDRKKLKEIMLIKKFEPHPLFRVIEGEIEHGRKFEFFRMYIYQIFFYYAVIEF